MGILSSNACIFQIFVVPLQSQRFKKGFVWQQQLLRKRKMPISKTFSRKQQNTSNLSFAFFKCLFLHM